VFTCKQSHHSNSFLLAPSLLAHSTWVHLSCFWLQKSLPTIPVSLLLNGLVVSSYRSVFSYVAASHWLGFRPESACHEVDLSPLPSMLEWHLEIFLDIWHPSVVTLPRLKIAPQARVKPLLASRNPRRETGSPADLLEHLLSITSTVGISSLLHPPKQIKNNIYLLGEPPPLAVPVDPPAPPVPPPLTPAYTQDYLTSSATPQLCTLHLWVHYGFSKGRAGTAQNNPLWWMDAPSRSWTHTVLNAIYWIIHILPRLIYYW
jgi:hypothetical protein